MIFLGLVIIASALASSASAQYSGANLACGNLTIPSTSLQSNSALYFTASVNDIMSFEFRLIAKDGRPLGWKELYDVDEDDDFLINYDCFVASTTDDGACGNIYVAAGETQGNYINRVLKIGYQKCSDWNNATHSTDVAIELRYAPAILSTPSTPTCTGLAQVVPTAFCSREGGAAAISATLSLALVFVFLTLSYLV